MKVSRQRIRDIHGRRSEGQVTAISNKLLPCFASAQLMDLLQPGYDTLL